jgi:hypothetical protein
MSLTANLPFQALTFWDACDYVLDQVVGGAASPRNRRLAVDAVREAYAELPMRRNWRYYYRSWTVQTVASQTSGTIAYDYTGGSSERMMTLTSNTWPSDVTKYAIYIAGIRYTIDTRVSSTVITLGERDCPTTDIDAGTSYTLTRDTYEIPDNCRTVFYLHDTNAPGRLLPCVEPSDIEHEQRIMRNTSLPLMFGCYRSELYSGAMAIHFAPSPSSVRTYQGHAIFWPQPLKVLEYTNGTVATTSGSTTVTGTGTTFTQDHVGCIVRVSATADPSIPTDLQGETYKDRLNPYALQRVIKSVESTTSLTLEQAADATLTGSGFRISSKIDIEPGAMRNAFLRCCEARFSTQDRKGAQEREARYEKALTLAMCADQRLDDKGGRYFLPTSLAGVASSTDLTTGGTQP